ncbi:MAG TPA: diaminopimelate decarboxylase [Cytophagales bacterium]|nr:diaminopimelate decarboxylase [Cytophagales bacterium]HAA23401.1 diaminopimelate decarboxylase [Cytophagales bacterium]HAP58118.1 diaminopimelate decarboxylase [Cytophagales bacterium]
MILQDDRYQIQGIDLVSLTETYGSPLYVYDGQKIVDQYHGLKDSFSKVKVNIKYAGKALTNQAILQLMKREGAGLDVVSIQEAQLGIRAGFEPHEILYTPNCVSFDEIKEAVELGVKINIDNISILEQFGHVYHGTVPICVRLNPHILAGGHHKISTGHIDSKFGISVHQLRHVLRVIDTNGLKVEGLHVHTGSDVLDPEVFLRGADIIFEAAHSFPDLQYIDFGSGFKVAYREGDAVTDISLLASRIEEAFLEFCQEYGRELEMWFEPGKYLVSEAGYMLVRTNVIKTTPATVFAGVDSGMNHLIRPMMYDAYHDIVNLSNPQGTQRVYTVVGYICETDTFGWDRKLNEVREGDILAIKNAGAYGFSMSSNYNSRFRPAEVLVYQGKHHLIRKRETMDDLLVNQVPVEW